MMSELDEIMLNGPMPKYTYRIIRVAYKKLNESGSYIIQYRAKWWHPWRTNGYWSLGMSSNFYRDCYRTAEEARAKIMRFQERAAEPLLHDKVIK